MDLCCRDTRLEVDNRRGLLLMVSGFYFFLLYFDLFYQFHTTRFVPITTHCTECLFVLFICLKHTLYDFGFGCMAAALVFVVVAVTDNWMIS